MTILWYRFCRKNIFLNTSSDKKLQNYRKVIESNQLTLNYFDQPLPVGNLRTRLNSKFNLEVSFNYSSFLQFSLSLSHTHTRTHSLTLSFSTLTLISSHQLIIVVWHPDFCQKTLSLTPTDCFVVNLYCSQTVPGQHGILIRAKTLFNITQPWYQHSSWWI